MVRTTLKLILLSVMVVAGTAGLYEYERRNSVRVQLDEQTRKTEALKQIVAHLQADRRVADIIVTEQKPAGDTLQTTLLFVEYARDGREMPPKRFTVRGNQAHVDALVIKFDREFVQQGDPLRGHSIALFHRLFGDHQTPAEGFPIDPPGQVPDLYKGDDSRVSGFEQELWTNFWRLTTDEAYRRQAGVRVAVAQSVWGPFEEDRLYTITLEAAGGLNITSEPLRGIYREALKQR